MDDEKLIELVRVHPAIYDLSHRKYMDNNFKANIWNNIGLQFGVSGLICKSRWSNIRDNFRKNIQKNVTKSGQGRNSKKPYKYHEQLSFLLKFFDDRNSIENVNGEGDPTQSDEFYIPQSPLPTPAMSPAPESHHTDSLTHSPTPSPASQHSQPSLTNQYGSSLSARSRGSRGRKQNNNDSVRTASSEVMDYLIRQNEHPVDIFLASLAPTLKELHPCDLFHAKTEMFAIVQKYESKLLRNKFPRLTHESSTTRQNRSNETVVMEDRGGAITSQDRSNEIYYETVMIDHGCTITSQDKSNAINHETVVVEDQGNTIVNQDRSNETVIMNNNSDNSIVLVQDSNNNYTIKGFYNAFSNIN